MLGLPRVRRVQQLLAGLGPTLFQAQFAQCHSCQRMAWDLCMDIQEIILNENFWNALLIIIDTT
jgi:hypothetical protein